MNKQDHLFIGAMAFVAFSLIMEWLNKTANFPWIIGLIVVSIGSIAPDFIEPATNWRHRGIFHGMGTLILIIPLFCLTSLITLIGSFFFDFTLFYYASCFLLGYLFHLLADSRTRMGLPN